MSAVVKDNIWLDRSGIFNTYPNIYVMLHADSGLKKGPPISMAKQLVQKTGLTRIISGRSSIQGILKDLGTAQTQPGGKVVSKSVAFICSSELASSIVDDPVSTKILTDLYDRSYNVGEWRSLLKMETFQLKDPTITMLTATNEAMAEDFFTKSAIQGGYFARTFIVYEKEGIVSNSLIFPLDETPDYKLASDYLKQLGGLTGPFQPLSARGESEEFKHHKTKFGREIWFSDAGVIYDDWYEDFKENIKNPELKDDTGTMNRFGDSVLKVAMLLSLAEHPQLIITATSMTEAIAQCEKLLGNVRKATLGKQGTSQTAHLKSMIIMEILNRDNHMVSRAVLMKKFWTHYSSPEEFDTMMNAFHMAGMILTDTIGNQVVYQMPEKQVLELKAYMAGKGKK